MSQCTPEDKKALEQFRKNVGDILEELDWYDSHDANLIRWIRARDYNLKKAEEMFRASMAWRREKNLDECGTSLFSEDFLKTLPFTPCGHDKDGALVCIIPVGKWYTKELLDAGRKEGINRHLLQILEHGTDYMRYISTEDKIYTQFSLVVDYDQFSYHNLASPKVISHSIELLKDYEANYPEKMNCTFLVNVPKIFEIGWMLIKPVMSQRTLSKIHILGGCPERWRKVLTSHIDCKDLLSKYGGSNTAHPWYHNELGTREWLPRAPLYPEDDFTTEVVPSGSSLTKTYNLQPGHRITWNFKTDSYDIGFEFRREDEPLFDYARTDAHLCVQDGLYDVSEAGAYSLVFDNTYSKYRSKTLHYVIHLE